MDQATLRQIDTRIISDLYLSRSGADFIEELVERYGARFGGTEEERAAAEFIRGRLESFGTDRAQMEQFACNGWTRRPVKLAATSPVEREIPCIALPFCPPGAVEGPLVYLGDGDPQTYADQRERLKGAVVMVSTATPRFYHRAMHRGEKLGRALEAGAAGFIWMRGEPGGLPETGAARFDRACEVPAISVSCEAGHELLRLGRDGQTVSLRIESACSVAPTRSFNVVGEVRGRVKPEEIIVVGAHYDGHDIGQAANDNAAGTAVVLEAARALAPHKAHLARTVRFVAFAQEELGLTGSFAYVAAHTAENLVFMLNLDGVGRGANGALTLQNWPEATRFFQSVCREMHEGQVAVGDRLNLYSDMYPFVAGGIPAASYTSSEPAAGGAPRGWGHTSWDSLDKLNPRGLQMDSIFVARLVVRLAAMGELPLARKAPALLGAKLKEMGLDEVLRYERRPVPGE